MEVSFLEIMVLCKICLVCAVIMEVKIHTVPCFKALCAFGISAFHVLNCTVVDGMVCLPECILCEIFLVRNALVGTVRIMVTFDECFHLACLT